MSNWTHTVVKGNQGVQQVQNLYKFIWCSTKLWRKLQTWFSNVGICTVQLSAIFHHTLTHTGNGIIGHVALTLTGTGSSSNSSSNSSNNPSYYGPLSPPHLPTLLPAVGTAHTGTGQEAIPPRAGLIFFWHLIGLWPFRRNLCFSPA